MWKRGLSFLLALNIVFYPSLSAAGVDVTDGSTVIQARGGSGGPGGGGSATVSNDPFTGAATSQIPIIVPRGAGGVRPRVALAYNSQLSNGWLGVGWSYSPGGIQRSLREGVPAYSSADTFQFNGEDLVLDSQTLATFHTRRESFLRIEHITTAGDYWVVRDKNGTVSRYGFNADARVVNPANGLPFAWHLDSVTDLHGNEIRYTYVQPPGTNLAFLSSIAYTYRSGALVGDERTVSFITEDRPDKPESYITGYRTLLDRRLAGIDVKVGGALVRRYDLAYTQSPDSGRSLLASVQEVGSDGTTALPATSFTYTNNTGAGGAMGWSTAGGAGWNLPGTLQFVEPDNKDTGVRLADVNGDGLVDVVRSKQNVAREVYLNNGSGFDATASAAWTVPVDLVDNKSKDKGFRFLDLDRDGLPDLLQIRERDGTGGYQGTDLAAYLNNGSTWVSTPAWSSNIDLVNHFTLKDGASGSNPEGPTQPVDLNGDGRVDLLMAKFFIFITTEFTNRGYQRNNGTGFDILQNDRYTICTDNTVACRLDSIFVQDQFCLGGNGVSLCAHLRLGKRLFDLNGDGLTDVVTSFHSNVSGSTTVNAYLNDGTDFILDDAWDVPPVIDLEKPNQGIPITHDQGVRIADVNGDGALDLVQARDDNGTLILNVWLNHQTTNGGSPWVLEPGWNVPVDAVFVDKNSKDLGVRLADVNGDGLPDLLIAGPAGTRNTYLNQGTRPDLLTGIVSPMGGTTSLTYTPSTQFDNTGGDGMPDLATPVWVVSAITTDDGMGQAGSVATTTFDYAGGAFDGARREFRGFEMVSSTRPDGSVVERHFHQSDGLQGFEKSSVVMGPAPGGGLTPLRQVDAAYAFMTATDAAPTVFFADGTTGALDPADPTLAAFSDWKARFTGAPDAALARLALLVQKDATVFDPADPAQAMSTQTLTEYDSRGNPTAEKFQGDVTVAGDERFTILEYATPADPATNLFGLPSHVYVTPASGAFADRAAETEILYDGAATFGTVTTGDITALRRWLKDPLTSTESYVTTGFAYDAHGNVSQVTADEGGLGIQKQIAYGPSGAYPTQIVAAAGGAEALTTLFEYDPPGAPPGLGLLKRRTEPDGNVTDFAFDALGRPTQATAGGGLAQVTRSYDLSAFPAVISTQILESGTALAPIHFVPLFSYLDGFGRPVRAARPSDTGGWIIEDTFFDPLGHTAKRSFPFAATDSSPAVVPLDESKPGSAFTYDALGLPLTATEPDEQGVLQTTAFTYLVGDLDGDGIFDQSRRRTDPAEKMQEVLVDARGNTTAVRDFDGATPLTTRYTYDLSDRLLSVTDPEGNLLALTYDTRGRRLRLIDPDAGTWLYAYDAMGRMTARTDPRANQLLFDYDALSRLTARRLDQGDGGSQTLATYTYDQGANALGRLSAIDDAIGQRTFQYDPLGRIAQVSQTLFGHPFAEDATYNALGAITTLTLPTGEVVRRTYLDGFLKKVEGLDRYATDLQYDVFGGLSHAALGNGDTLDFSFFPNGRLAGIQSNSGQVQDLAYSYDPNGNISGIADALDPNASRNFTYDDLNRLTSATGASTNLTYAYSPSGNLTAKEGQPQLYTLPDHPHAVSQAIGLTIAYDAAGNLTSAGDHAFTYNEEGRMTEARQGGVLAGSYDYDAAGNRVRKTVSGVETLFFYGVEGVVTTEADGAGLVTTSYVYVGPRRVAKVNNDVDGDGVENVLDNCADVPNPAQADADADNLGDACDAAPNNPDQDGDGLLDGDEVRTYHTDPANPDTDGDGVGDGVEVAQGFDPLDPQSTPPLGGTIPALSAVGIALFLFLFFLSVAIVQRRRRGALDRAARLYLALFVWLALQVQLSRTAWAALGEYIHPDHLGSTRVLRDGAGNETRRLTYKPFGDTESDTGTGEIRYEYTGGALDAETGLYYLGARYYAPVIGRFLQPDDLGNPFDPQTLNRYTYARNNPVNFLDPTGTFFLAFLAAFGSFLGGVLGGASNFVGGVASAFGLNLSALPVLGGAISTDSSAFFVGQQFASLAVTVAGQRGPGFSLGDAGASGIEVEASFSGARSFLLREVSSGAGEAGVEQPSQEDLGRAKREDLIRSVLKDLREGKREISLADLFDEEALGPRGNVSLKDVVESPEGFTGRFENSGKEIVLRRKPGVRERDFRFQETLIGDFSVRGGKNPEFSLTSISGLKAPYPFTSFRRFFPEVNVGFINITPEGVEGGQ